MACMGHQGAGFVCMCVHVYMRARPGTRVLLVQCRVACGVHVGTQALVDLHGEDEGLGGKLTEDEVQIICGKLWSCLSLQHAS